MPFAVDGGLVAGIMQKLGEEGLLPWDAPRYERVNREAGDAVSEWVAAGHQSRPSGGADVLHVVIGQAHACLREGIDARRHDASGGAATALVVIAHTSL